VVVFEGVTDWDKTQAERESNAPRRCVSLGIAGKESTRRRRRRTTRLCTEDV